MSDTEKADNAENYNPEDEVQGDWKPLYDLPDIEAKTGEEDEEVVGKYRVKLYRFANNEWKERGKSIFKCIYRYWRLPIQLEQGK